MASRSLDDLDPRVQGRARDIVRAWADRGLDVILTCTFRSNAEQSALYQQGRDGHPGPKVTNARAGESLHNRGLAIDFVPLVNGKAAWNDEALFSIVAGIAMEADPSVSWGGSWKGWKDRPHLEWKDERSGDHGALVGNTLPGESAQPKESA